MSADPRTEAWKRLNWADENGRALEAEVKGFVKAQPYSVRIDLQGDQGTATLCRLIDPAAEAEVLDRCSRLIGSYLDHMRAALNYLTYQVALLDAPANPKLDPDTTEFPIFKDRSLYAKKNRIKHLSNEHRAAIESVQPYDGELPGLWLLHELSRVYRHRLLHASKVGTFDEAHSVEVTGGTLESLDVLYTGVVEDETPVLAFTVAHEGQAHAHANVVVAICIDDPLCRGQHAMSVLNAIAHDAGQAITVLGGILRPSD